MTRRYVYLAHLGATAFFFLLTIIIGMVGTILDAHQLTASAVFPGVATFLLALGLKSWIDIVPAPLPPRSVREALRDEAHRIYLETETELLERQARRRLEQEAEEYEHRD